MINKTIDIAGRKIGPGYKPFIIAEMSGNHNQSLEKALAIVDAAAHAGADALKLQTYTADTMTLDLNEREFQITDPQSLWYGQSLYELYQKAYTPWDWHEPIKKRCQELGLIFFSTPFDETAVDFLENLDVPCYKIASFEIIDLPLIRKVASTGKPIIMSTGMATLSEIEGAVSTARRCGCDDIILLKCTSSYPADARDCNVRTIPHLADAFQVLSGLSDHTLGIGVAIAAVALGATVIEKHFTLNRQEGGVDAAFSMEPDEFKQLVSECLKARNSLGEVKYGASSEKEEKSKVFRRSLYVVKDCRKGDKITRDNIRCIRPGFGLAPHYLDVVLGKEFRSDVKKGTPLSWEII